MAMLVSMTARSVAADTPGLAFRLFGPCRAGIARYFAHRDALARLREFSDAELLDIGLTRSQIEPAVRGLAVNLPDWPRR